MKPLSPALGLLLVCLLGAGVGVRAGDSDSDSDGDAAVARSLRRVRRGGWNMYRLGRGLQMLRLGKRGALTPEDLDDWLTPGQVPRAQSSRQLPLPRYGKDTDWARAQLLAAKLTSPGGAVYGGLRPAPRGGRFKRGAPYPQDLVDLLSRAVALPRIGRLVYGDDFDAVVGKVKDDSLEKDRAVPAPRIGRSL